MRRVARKLPPVCSHQWIDLVDLVLHRAMARKIRREPKLFNRARRNLARWEKRNRGCPPPWREWKQILCHNDMNAVLRIMTRADEEGNRLRQSSPFCGILTEREREVIWARYPPPVAARIAAWRVGREAARTLVAIRLFWDQRRKLPNALEDLVKSDILESVPIDQYSGEPLQYSKQGQLIWSIAKEKYPEKRYSEIYGIKFSWNVILLPTSKAR